MRLTGDAVEYHATTTARRPGARRMSAIATAAPAVAARPRHAGQRRPLGVDQAVDPALDALVAAGRGGRDAGLGIGHRRCPDEPLGAARPRDLARFDSIDIGVSGYHLAQLAIGVLGVLVITGEYSPA